MSKAMLIDAAHSEETRVVVVGPNGLEEFDFESASLRTLKGNIYLAKVTRVEPSLQAAFVSFGGNRHGFLPFNEIHPDYYRIPIADREALAAADAADRQDRLDEEEDDDATDDNNDETADAADEDDSTDISDNQPDASDEAEPEANDSLTAAGSSEEPAADAPSSEDARSDDVAPDSEAPADATAPEGETSPEAAASDDTEGDDAADAEVKPEDADANDAERPRRRQRRRSQPRKHYKIQEVIKRGQIMLVQVAKEERGGKGAAITTYISLAGRYCVLMPNTGKGGGISRKITDAKDRKRLKTMIADLDLPDGMAVIVRTAGVQRTKAEIKRDHEFLLRLWEEIRERTLGSNAPALIYEEASLVKRSIRDLYSRDVDEVLVEGDIAYREAKDFMRSLMPSHAKRVQPYKETTPLFQARGVERRLESLFEPTVRLPSGGYLVINQTEALVAIDVNSGRSTRERNIEETAVKTNLEAAAEAAHQLRLRELAGIVVIDFIDMDDRRNNAAVERKLKDALKADRARVHVGRMSPLGLIEMSRQRLRPSMFETSFHECPQCAGLGRVRSVESNALGILRAAEDCATEAGSGANIGVTAATAAVVYIINHKRDAIARIETTYGVRIMFSQDDTLGPDERNTEVLSKGEPVAKSATAVEDAKPPQEDRPTAEDSGEKQERGGRRGRGRGGRNRRNDADEKPVAEAAEVSEPSEAKDETEEDGSLRRKRSRRGGRRRGKGGGEDAEVANTEAEGTNPESDTPDGEAAPTPAANDDSEENATKGRRRRRRRGGRRTNGDEQSTNAEGEGSKASEENAASAPSSTHDEDVSKAPAANDDVTPASEAPVAAETSPREAVEPKAETPTQDDENDAPVVEAVAPEPVVEPAPVIEAEPEAEIAPEPEPEPEPEEPTGPPRTGWWRRLRS